MTTQENHNLYTRFHKVFENRLDSTLLVTDAGDEYRYAELESESARLARFLAEAGAVPGDRISVQTAKTPQALCLYLACLRGGLCVPPPEHGLQGRRTRILPCRRRTCGGGLRQREPGPDRAAGATTVHPAPVYPWMRTAQAHWPNGRGIRTLTPSLCIGKKTTWRPCSTLPAPRASPRALS